MAVNTPDLKAFLVATPFFGGISDAGLDLLISMLVERRFDAASVEGNDVDYVRKGSSQPNQLKDVPNLWCRESIYIIENNYERMIESSQRSG